MSVIPDTKPKLPKTLRNPLLRQKFQSGQKVSVPRNIAYRFTNKLLPLPQKVTGTVVSIGDGKIGRHYRFVVAIDMDTSVASHIKVWEEWMLERITPA